MTDHTQRSHALWSPSASKRSVACPGSVSYCENEPRSSDKFSARGTVGHEIAQKAIEVELLDYDAWIGTVIEKDGHRIEVDARLLDEVEIYVDYCLSLIDEDAIHGQEIRVPLSPLGFDLDTSGLVDFWLLKHRTLHSVDVKTGFTPVPVKGNRQLRTYALGLVMWLQSKGHQIDSVVLTIVQPTDEAYPIKSEQLTLSELAFWGMELRQDIARAYQARDDMATMAFEPWAAKWLAAGEHCHYCPKAHICPALVGTALRLKNTYYDNLPPAELVSLKEQSEVLAAWKKGLDSKMLSLADAGVTIPGYVIDETMGDREYVDEGAAVRAIMAKSGCTEADLYNRKLKSPAQAEKLLPKGDKKATMAALTTRRVTGKKLVKVENSKSPAKPLVEQYFEKP